MSKFTEGSFEWYRAVLNQIISGDMSVYQNQKDCLDLLLNMNIDLPFTENLEAQQMAIKVSKYELRFYQDMIDEFFKSELGQRNGKSFDRHIWLFFSERNQDILCERVKQKWEEEVECQ